LLEHRVSPYVQFSVLVNEVLLLENSNFQRYIEVECLKVSADSRTNLMWFEL